MMQISEPRLRSLLRQAKKVANSGKRAAAIQLYHQIIEEAPESKAAWLGLAQLLREPAEKEGAYRKVLELDPDNETAQAELARLRGEPSPEKVEPEGDTVSDDGAVSDDAFNRSRDWLEAATARKDKPPVAEPAESAPDPVPFPTADDAGPGQVVGEEETFDLVCYRHPDRRTSLRCYTCDRPICSQCAIPTPVGYRCPVCVREAEDVFFNARPLDYVLALLVSLPLSLLAGFLVINVGRGFFFILLMFFIGGAVGSLIGRITKRVVGRRRGRYLPHLVAASVVLGVVIPALPVLLAVLFGNVAALGLLITPGIYLFVATGAAFYQMK